MEQFTTIYLEPTRVLKRAELSATFSTDANGCVVCPSLTPKGPLCGKGQEQLLRTQTCHQCPEYYCSKVSGSGGTKNIGGIVGGVVGGVVVLFIAGLIYYFMFWRKKHPSLGQDEEEDIIMSDLEMEGEDKASFSNDSNVNNDDENNGNNVLNVTKEGATQLRPPNRRANSNPNRRLSSYESFTRPQIKVNNRSGRGRRVGQRQVRNMKTGETQANTQFLPYNNPSYRNSVATTISTTNASNILPVAYIPGVTVRPTKNNTKSIYSYETDSIFSDLNTIENASIIGDIMKANYSDNNTAGNNNTGSNTMTAIKAQPRLVNIDRIDEEDEDDSELTDSESHRYNVSHDNSLKSSNTNINSTTLSNLTSTIEEESDSDVDSDIGEIQRATSITRNTNQVREVVPKPTKEFRLL